MHKHLKEKIKELNKEISLIDCLIFKDMRFCFPILDEQEYIECLGRIQENIYKRKKYFEEYKILKEAQKNF